MVKSGPPVMLKSNVLLPSLVEVRSAPGQRFSLWLHLKLHHSKLFVVISSTLQDAWYYKYILKFEWGYNNSVTYSLEEIRSLKRSTALAPALCH